MEDFRNVDNMKLCISIFEKYMNDKFNINIKNFKDTNAKIELYNIMNNVSSDSSFINHNLKTQNNIVINELKNVYVDKYNIVENKKTHVKNLDRENTIYEGRRNIPRILQPELTSIKNDIDTISFNFETLQKERGLVTTKEEIKHLSKPINISPINEEDFSKQLKERENSRNDIFQNLLSSPDPKEIFKHFNEQDKDKDIIDIPNKKYINFSEQKLIDQPKTTNITRYVLINGNDRNISLYPNRYQFTVDFSKLTKTYKNIQKIAFNNLIIPSNINDSQLINSGLASQFLFLNIEELQDVYDGFNESTKKCFTQFIYDKSYTTSNGRGYIIMKPAQMENKMFHQATFSMLQRLSFSITKPSGVLYNDSKDNNFILKLEYEIFNPMYLKIITNTFFEKNDYYIEDTVIFNNFMFPVLEDNDTSSDEYIEYKNNKFSFDKIMEFINRPQGHEIAQIGKPNENGFFRSFYIKNMTKFDQNCGKIVVDKLLLDTITEYNNRDSPIYKPSGNIVNISLQLSLSCQIDMVQSDSSTIRDLYV